MDDLLKAYAQKRREEAGAPLELHPATRRLFQAEVARLRSRPGSAGTSWLQVLVRLWLRLAFALSLAVVLGICVWVLVPHRPQEQKLAQQAAPAERDLFRADKSLDQNAPVSAEAKPAKESPAIPTPQAVGEEKMPSAPQRRLDVAQSKQEGVAAPAPADEARRLALKDNVQLHYELQPKAQAGEPTQQLFADQDRLARGRLDTPSPTPPTSPAPSAPQSKASALGEGSGGGWIAGRASQDNLTLGVREKLKAAENGLAALNQSLTNLDTRFYAQRGTGDSSQVFKREQAGLAYDALNQAATPRAAAPGGVAGAFGGPLVAQDQAAANLALSDSYQHALAPSGQVSIAGGAKPASQLADSASRAGQSQASSSTLAGMAPQAARGRSEPSAYGSYGSLLRDRTRERFQQSTATPTAVRGAARQRTGGQPVLNSFELERNGDRIRIIDADGSVYEGQLLAGAEAAKQSGAEKRVPVKMESQDEKAADLSKSLADAPAKRDLSGPAAASSFSFRASGDNRTLGQRVEIEATLTSPVVADAESALKEASNRNAPAPATAPAAAPVAAPAAPAPAARPAPTAAPPPAVVSGQVPAMAKPAQTTMGRAQQPVAVPTVRVQGKARIGTNEMKIDAARVAR